MKKTTIFLFLLFFSTFAFANYAKTVTEGIYYQTHEQCAYNVYGVGTVHYTQTRLQVSSTSDNYYVVDFYIYATDYPGGAVWLHYGSSGLLYKYSVAVGVECNGIFYNLTWYDTKNLLIKFYFGNSSSFRQTLSAVAEGVTGSRQLAPYSQGVAPADDIRYSCRIPIDQQILSVSFYADGRYVSSHEYDVSSMPNNYHLNIYWDCYLENHDDLQDPPTEENPENPPPHDPENPENPEPPSPPEEQELPPIDEVGGLEVGELVTESEPEVKGNQSSDVYNDFVDALNDSGKTITFSKNLFTGEKPQPHPQDIMSLVSQIWGHLEELVQKIWLIPSKIQSVYLPVISDGDLIIPFALTSRTWNIDLTPYATYIGIFRQLNLIFLYYLYFYLCYKIFFVLRK